MSSARNFLPYFLIRSWRSVSEMATASSRTLEDQQTLLPSDRNNNSSSRNLNMQQQQPDIPNFDAGKTASLMWMQLFSVITVTAVSLSYAFYTGSTQHYHDLLRQQEPERRPPECFGYYTLLVLRAVLWAFTYGVHLHQKVSHNRLKLLGYHNFLEKVHHFKKAPLQIVTAVNVMLLTLHNTFEYTLDVEFLRTCKLGHLAPASFAIGLISLLETVCLTLVHVLYFVELRVFSLAQYPPDAMRMSDTPPLLGGVSVIGGDAGNGTPYRVNLDELYNQQFLMTARLMDENRNLQDRIRELRSASQFINSESTHISLVDQSLLGY